jgi:hypothetical protein
MKRSQRNHINMKLQIQKIIRAINTEQTKWQLT